MNAETDPIENLQAKLLAFAAERDWEQFQAPKNLSMALAVEAAELMEHFQWLSEDESRQLDSDKLAHVEEELADVFLYLLLLAKRLNVDIFQASSKKMQRNAEKYPAEQVKGSAKKYYEYRKK